ncbi:3-oxoacyl-ACP synthase III family protein [Streptomyces sp. NPDC056883]|uniref:3-oxoacyl-ACP synthase III family protein n=1 Tax=Streptomyces sp. NPDC056883 TaxID=3345959 RepID=UPI00367F9F85
MDRPQDQAGVGPEELAYIVVDTSTPDHPQPSTASIVQHRLGAVNAAAFDLNAVCSGFVYALTVAERMFCTEPGDRCGLVIGADIHPRILDYSDRRTAILFGGGAGAVVLGPAPNDRGIFATSLLTRGDQHELISVPAGGSRTPTSVRTLDEGLQYFRMDGRRVREFAQAASSMPSREYPRITEASASSRAEAELVEPDRTRSAVRIPAVDLPSMIRPWGFEQTSPESPAAPGADRPAGRPSTLWNTSWRSAATTKPEEIASSKDESRLAVDFPSILEASSSMQDLPKTAATLRNL